MDNLWLRHSRSRTLSKGREQIVSSPSSHIDIPLNVTELYLRDLETVGIIENISYDRIEDHRIDLSIGIDGIDYYLTITDEKLSLPSLPLLQEIGKDVQDIWRSLYWRFDPTEYRLSHGHLERVEYKYPKTIDVKIIYALYKEKDLRKRRDLTDRLILKEIQRIQRDEDIALIGSQEYGLYAIDKIDNFLPSDLVRKRNGSWRVETIVPSFLRREAASESKYLEERFANLIFLLNTREDL